MDRSHDGSTPPSVSEASPLAEWQRRAVRAWVILVLPIAAFFTYQAVDAHFEAQSAHQAAMTWFERDLQQDREGIPKGTFSIDPKEQYRESIIWQREELDRRDRSGFLAVLLLTLPLAGWIGVKAALWIWVGGKPKEAQPALTGGIGAARSSLAKLGQAALLFVPATAATATMFVVAPTTAVKVLVSTTVQAVVVVLAVWIYRRFKR